MTYVGEAPGSSFSKTSHNDNFFESMYLHFATRMERKEIRGLRGRHKYFLVVSLYSFSLESPSRSVFRRSSDDEIPLILVAITPSALRKSFCCMRVERWMEPHPRKYDSASRTNFCADTGSCISALS